MRAIRYRGPRNFTVAEEPDPEAGADEVLIAPLAVGICFTDKHLFDGYLGDGRGQIGGHEFSGRVVSVGANVSGLATGDLVSVDPRIRCGQCLQCRAGLSTLCEDGARLLGVDAGLDGGLADLCVVPAYACHPLPTGLSALSAAAAEPACCATRAVRHAGVRIGDNVVVFGGEDYGLYATSWLRSAGVDNVVVVDPFEVRRRAAKATGASFVLDPGPDLLDEIRDIAPFGADVAFVNFEDYVKESELYLQQAFDAVRIQGTVVILRAYSGTPFGHVVPHPPWLKEITLKHFGNFFGEEPVQGDRSRGDWALTLRAMADGRIAAPTAEVYQIDFAELCDAADVAETMALVPERHTKLMVTMRDR